MFSELLLQLYTVSSMGSSLFNECNSAEMFACEQDSEISILENDSLDTAAVCVPDVHLPLSESSISTLKATIDPLYQCDDHGVQLYVECLHLVFQLMQNDNLVDCQ